MVDGDQGDQQEQHRNGQEDVDDPHQQRVEPAAEEARHGAVEGAEYRGHQGRGEADDERGLPPEHQPTEDVEARSRRCPGDCRCPGGAFVGGVLQGQLGIGLVGRVEVGPDEAEQHEEDDDAQSHDGQLVLAEDPGHLAEDAAGRPATRPPREPGRPARSAARRSWSGRAPMGSGVRSSSSLKTRVEAGGLRDRSCHSSPSRIRGSATA